MLIARFFLQYELEGDEDQTRVDEYSFTTKLSYDLMSLLMKSLFIGDNFHT